MTLALMLLHGSPLHLVLAMSMYLACITSRRRGSEAMSSTSRKWPPTCPRTRRVWRDTSPAWGCGPTPMALAMASSYPLQALSVDRATLHRLVKSHLGPVRLRQDKTIQLHRTHEKLKICTPSRRKKYVIFQNLKTAAAEGSPLWL